MSVLAFWPLLLGIVAAFGARFVVHTFRPRTAVQLLCAVAVAAAVSTAAAVAVMVLAALDSDMARHVAGAGTGASGTSGLIEWCAELYGHQAPRWAGLVGIAILIVGAVRVVRCWRRWRAAVAPWRGAAPVQVVPGPSTEAFAVPGRPGAIVIGQGLLDALAPEERRAVLAHERAHLTHRHHRYLQLAEASAGAFPFLAPLAGQVRYATERWADEVAAESVGDRRVVARAIVKAALSASPDSLLPAVASGQVTARVAALLSEHPTSRHWYWAGHVSLVSVALTLATASVQVHHLGVYLSHASLAHL